MHKRTFSIITLLYIALWVIVFFSRSNIPVAEVFSSDASEYSRAAIHLLQSGFYSLDGVHAFFAREPGYSLFLAVLYFLFGIENSFALFVVQGLLYYFACLFFVRSLPSSVSQRAATICFALLLTHISVFHTIFSAYRECFALILLLVFSATLLLFLCCPTFLKACISGVLLGYAILTYYSFLLFPFFLLLVLWIHRVRLRYALPLFFIPFLVISPWLVRNSQYSSNERSEAMQRMTYVWYVRAEQAEKVRGLEPLRCLWSEYVSRDWSNRSHACSFNGVKNTKWPNGILHGDEDQLAVESRHRILQSFPSYLWFSIIEILELHLPYLGGGWSFTYNLSASLASLLLYIGFLFGISSMRDKNCTLFVALIFYNTLVFILTDATPRYLLPIIFCYTFFSALGYERMLRWHKRL